MNILACLTSIIRHLSKLHNFKIESCGKTIVLAISVKGYIFGYSLSFHPNWLWCIEPEINSACLGVIAVTWPWNAPEGLYNAYLKNNVEHN